PAADTRAAAPAIGMPPLPAYRFSRDSALLPFATPHHGSAQARDWQITLKNAIIEKYKNRALIATPYQVLFFKFHDVEEDGDAHVAGLADEVGLACVAEMMNVKDRDDAKKLVQSLKESGDITTVVGVWRLWCEHPDQHPQTAGPQIQDD